MNEPRWLSKNLLLAIHGRLLAEHGGDSGLRDEGLLESALMSPKQHLEYADVDLFDLAAAYAYAISKNHPFLDGNKRVALVTAAVFLELNGQRLTASEPDAVAALLALSRSEIEAAEFAAWLRMNSEKLPPESG